MFMELVDLYHAKVITFNIGESERFRKLITLAITVETDYCHPNSNIIGGELLDINWNSYQTKTTKDLMERADVLGIFFLRDLANMKGCPLISIIAYSFNVPMAVLVVKD